MQCERSCSSNGVNGGVLRVVQRFYRESGACVRAGGEVSEWFDVTVGLGKCCVMSSL